MVEFCDIVYGNRGRLDSYHIIATATLLFEIIAMHSS